MSSQPLLLQPIENQPAIQTIFSQAQSPVLLPNAGVKHKEEMLKSKCKNLEEQIVDQSSLIQDLTQ